MCNDLTYDGMPAKVLGKIEAERPCDNCGTNLLKTAVVIEVGNGQQIQIGRQCAAAKLFGKKSSANGKRVDAVVYAADKAAKHKAADFTAWDKRAAKGTDKCKAIMAAVAVGYKGMVGFQHATNGTVFFVVNPDDAVMLDWMTDRGFTLVGNPFPEL